jgi:hypothetical protein
MFQVAEGVENAFGGFCWTLEGSAAEASAFKSGRGSSERNLQGCLGGKPTPVAQQK